MTEEEEGGGRERPSQTCPSNKLTHQSPPKLLCELLHKTISPLRWRLPVQCQQFTKTDAPSVGVDVLFIFLLFVRGLCCYCWTQWLTTHRVGSHHCLTVTCRPLVRSSKYEGQRTIKSPPLPPIFPFILSQCSNMKPDTVDNSRHESYNGDKGILLTPSLSTTAAVYSKRRKREIKNFRAGRLVLWEDLVPE